MRFSGKETLYSIRQNTCDIGAEQAGTGTKPAHCKAQQHEPDCCIRGKMLHIRMQPNSSKNSPPLALIDRRRIQNASALQIVSGCQPREEDEEYHPRQGGPIEHQSALENLSLPRPMA